jgi:hypothetical protein
MINVSFTELKAVLSPTSVIYEKEKWHEVRFEVLTAADVRMAVFCGVASCSQSM